MSANNWTVCPRCKENAVRAYISVQEEFDKAYGVVSLSDYKKLEAAVSKLVDFLDEFPTDLREDWEIGMDEDGILNIEYACSCKMCGSEFNYSDKVNLLRKENP